MRHYFNYNLIKKKIKILWDNQKKEKDSSVCNELSEKANRLQTIPIIDKMIADPIDKLLLSSLGKYISEFLCMIDQEIKKFYNFFHKIEENLYKEINSHLYIEENYK